MSGKYRKCFIPALISVFGCVCILFAAVPGQEEKDDIYVNGYHIIHLSESNLTGLQFKAIGDMYLRQGAYARALSYYEKAASYLPNEADIYFNLGNIYQYHKIYALSLRYYQTAIERYAYPENNEKSKKNLYLSQIRRGYALEELDRYDEAKLAAADLFKIQSDITNAFPEIRDEMIAFFKSVYGDYYEALMNY